MVPEYFVEVQDQLVMSLKHTGDLYEHLQNLKKSKVTIYVSGMSAKSRGYDEKLLDGYSAEFVMPDVLVEESIKADSVLCY